MDRLPEGLDDRDTAHIFCRFTAHDFKRVLVLLHFLLHVFPHHFHHAAKSDDRRNNTDQSDLPVKGHYQNDQTDRGNGRHSLICKIMRDICFCSRCGIIHDTADLSGAILVKNSERQGNDPSHQGTTHVRLHAECRDMRTQEGQYIDQKRADGYTYCDPCMSFDQVRILTFHRDLNDPPQFIIRDQRHHSADRRQESSQQDQILMPSGIISYELHVIILFHFCQIQSLLLIG